MQISTVLNGSPEVQVAGVVASDGALIFPDSCDQTIARNGDNTVNYIEVVVPPTPGTTYTGGTYRQTFGYTNSLVTSISRWVKQ